MNDEEKDSLLVKIILNELETDIQRSLLLKLVGELLPDKAEYITTEYFTELKNRSEEFLNTCPDLHPKVASRNFFEVRNWIRHLSSQYGVDPFASEKQG